MAAVENLLGAAHQTAIAVFVTFSVRQIPSQFLQAREVNIFCILAFETFEQGTEVRFDVPQKFAMCIR